MAKQRPLPLRTLIVSDYEPGKVYVNPSGVEGEGKGGGMAAGGRRDGKGVTIVESEKKKKTSLMSPRYYWRSLSPGGRKQDAEPVLRVQHKSNPVNTRAASGSTQTIRSFIFGEEGGREIDREGSGGLEKGPLLVSRSRSNAVEVPPPAPRRSRSQLGPTSEGTNTRSRSTPPGEPLATELVPKSPLRPPASPSILRRKLSSSGTPQRKDLEEIMGRGSEGDRLGEGVSGSGRDARNPGDNVNRNCNSNSRNDSSSDWSVSSNNKSSSSSGGGGGGGSGSSGSGSGSNSNGFGICPNSSSSSRSSSSRSSSSSDSVKVDDRFQSGRDSAVASKGVEERRQVPALSLSSMLNSSTSNSEERKTTLLRESGLISPDSTPRRDGVCGRFSLLLFFLLFFLLSFLFFFSLCLIAKRM